ncbi:uncharacterized protein LOC129591065 [Paramacrobiotus metropolitanus]|uniref:uncharacterized protein LOC129591065 n=1 Tax=Paramacrobiotus metropolitanus TaxID=2943436 RepID=UPI00244658AA|nr:uncharacterized protein LOC129591065 [Paramacrobiotus metropolitanus]
MAVEGPLVGDPPKGPTIPAPPSPVDRGTSTATITLPPPPVPVTTTATISPTTIVTPTTQTHPSTLSGLGFDPSQAIPSHSYFGSKPSYPSLYPTIFPNMDFNFSPHPATSQAQTSGADPNRTNPLSPMFGPSAMQGQMGGQSGTPTVQQPLVGQLFGPPITAAAPTGQAQPQMGQTTPTGQNVPQPPGIPPTAAMPPGPAAQPGQGQNAPMLVQLPNGAYAWMASNGAIQIVPGQPVWAQPQQVPLIPQQPTPAPSPPYYDAMLTLQTRAGLDDTMTLHFLRENVNEPELRRALDIRILKSPAEFRGYVRQYTMGKPEYEGKVRNQGNYGYSQGNSGGGPKGKFSKGQNASFSGNQSGNSPGGQNRSPGGQSGQRQTLSPEEARRQEDMYIDRVERMFERWAKDGIITCNHCL